jgi:mRNA interferase MazF
VLSRDAAIPRVRRALVAPCPATIRGLSSEVRLEPGRGVSIAVLVDRIGRLSDERMRQICAALEVAVDCQH